MCRVKLPQIEIGDIAYLDSPYRVKGGVIKLEIIDHVAYATTSESPLADNGDGSYSFVGGGFRVTHRSGISDIAAGTDISITTSSGAIRIIAPKDVKVVVYDIAGRILYTGKAGTIACKPGFYIVKAGGKTSKVCVI